ncbi:hypothetical protein ACQP2U_42425 (plasmid) [Nocardia sp. CA-084685]|uniref:hypothetical protein n=1 Tax=Nocardia sp. CA-084685 TaxID=3239970 RepID=UPI003D999521
MTTSTPDAVWALVKTQTMRHGHTSLEVAYAETHLLELLCAHPNMVPASSRWGWLRAAADHLNARYNSDHTVFFRVGERSFAQGTPAATRAAAIQTALDHTGSVGPDTRVGLKVTTDAAGPHTDYTTAVVIDVDNITAADLTKFLTAARAEQTPPIPATSPRHQSMLIDPAAELTALADRWYDRGGHTATRAEADLLADIARAAEHTLHSLDYPGDFAEYMASSDADEHTYDAEHAARKQQAHRASAAAAAALDNHLINHLELRDDPTWGPVIAPHRFTHINDPGGIDTLLRHAHQHRHAAMLTYGETLTNDGLTAAATCGHLHGTTTTPTDDPMSTTRGPQPVNLPSTVDAPSPAP